MKKQSLLALILSLILLTACSNTTASNTEANDNSQVTHPSSQVDPSETEEPMDEPHSDEALSTIQKIGSIDSEEAVNRLLDQLSIEEKVGQLIQTEPLYVSLDDISNYNIGFMLSSGGVVPNDNSPQGWKNLMDQIIGASQKSSSGIPLVYGIDAVHGNNNVYAATIFPHNIGLGAANDPDLLYQIGQATGNEVLATGIKWDFAPAVSVVQDIRWGRTYESYSENVDRVASLAPYYIKGLQETGVMATTKHFIGDGQTTYGTGISYQILDRGDVQTTTEELLRVNEKAYQAAIDAGTASIMASYSSVNGTKMHANHDLLNDVLRDQLAFKGLVVSDYNAIDVLAPNLKDQVAIAINSGVDVIMEPSIWKQVYEAILDNVNDGTLSEDRLDEAVRHALLFKLKAGVFKPDYKVEAGEIGTDAHHQLARQAVSESLVLLQNKQDTLPLKKSSRIYLMGPAADNVGIQSGGWTTNWQGTEEPDTNAGVSIKDAFEIALSESSGQLVDTPQEADVIVLAIGEKPYAEMHGDTDDLSLEGPLSLPDNLSAIEEANTYNKPVVTLIVAGRPLLVDEYLKDWNSLVMTWLPGSEGQGITDVLFGDKNFDGTLPVTWPKTNDQATGSMMQPDYNGTLYQFPYDFGLTY